MNSKNNPRLVRDLMSVGVLTCGPNIPVTEVAQALLDKKLEGLVVLDELGHALGIITWNELVKAYSHGMDEPLRAEEVMRDGVPQVPPDIPLTAAAQIMQDLDVRVLFLMHHAGGIEYPAAMLTYKHLIRHMAGGTLDDLGIQAERESPLETFIRRRDEARQKAEMRSED